MFTRSARSRSHRLGGMFLAAILATPLYAPAAPVILEETAKIPSPDPDPEFGWPIGVAIDGDWLLAAGSKYELDSELTNNSIWLYQRQPNGTWTLVRKLHEFRFNEEIHMPPIQLALQNGVAVIVKEFQSWIFERSGNDWIQVPSPIQTRGRDLALNGGTILVTAGVCTWQSNAYRKGSDGAWTLVRQTPPEPDPEYDCEGEDTRGDLDVAPNGTTSIVATYGYAYPTTARIFEGPFGSPPFMTRVSWPNLGIGYDVAIENTNAILTGGEPGDTQAYTRDSTGQWVHSGPLMRPDYLDVGTPFTVELAGTLALLPQRTDALHGQYTGSVGIFERNADGTYRYAARLLASDRRMDQNFGNWPVIRGRRVAVANSRTRSAYIFDLPSTLIQPATLQDNFEDGNASDWTPQVGSTFTVGTAASSRVYRQSNTTGNAASLWNSADRENQSIEADIRPTVFAASSGDKWFGLVTRYTSASNYYYVTLRNNNTVLLRRMVDGVFTTLASAGLPITLNRSYRVRLETIGTRLRVFVDNRLLAEASDDALDSGRAGVMMYKTQTDYDNIVVSSNPQTRLVTYQFGSAIDSRSDWETLGTWTPLNLTFAQSDTTSGARAITGIPTGDQVVHARMQRTGTAGTNNWFGLATRYRDEGNYYYVTLRNDNTVSLRKLVNGAIVELDSAPLSIASNTWYRVRFEAIGDQLRVYVNEVLRLDATDASHATGRYGPVMYRTAAQYDDILAVEP